MRLLVALSLLALPLAAATKPLPSHVTLVRPAIPAKKPILQSLVIPQPPAPRLVAKTAACAHAVIVPVDPRIDANIVRHESLPTAQMPVHTGTPACR